MTSKHRWIFVIVLSALADTFIRFGTNFDFFKVMVGEAILFPFCALVFAIFIRFDRNGDAWPRWIRLSLAWFYGLGGLRCLLWTSGAPLRLANFATIGLTLIVILFYAVMHRGTWTGGRSAKGPTSGEH